MALISCPECQKEISDQADSCPHCGYSKLKTKEVADSSEGENKTGGNSGCAILISVLGGGFILLLAIIGIAGNGKDTPTHTATDACFMAQKFVTDRLKAPATADFQSCSESNISTTDNWTYLVSSYVDAQNSFGAKIRTNYVAKLTYMGAGKWNLNLLDGL